MLSIIAAPLLSCHSKLPRLCNSCCVLSASLLETGFSRSGLRGMTISKGVIRRAMDVKGRVWLNGFTSSIIHIKVSQTQALIPISHVTRGEVTQDVLKGFVCTSSLSGWRVVNVYNRSPVERRNTKRCLKLLCVVQNDIAACASQIRDSRDKASSSAVQLRTVTDTQRSFACSFVTP